MIGVDTTARAIAEHYGARNGNGLLDGWLVAPGDAAIDAAPVGIAVGGAPLLMTDPAATADMVRAACALVGVSV